MFRLLAGIVIALIVSGVAVPKPVQAQSGIVLSAEEDAILRAVNDARATRGLQPLKVSAPLMRAARDHAANMARQRTMAHVLDGRGLGDRLTAMGYGYQAAGENVAFGDPTYSVERIFQGWMESPPHRANILQRDFAAIGIGIATASNGRKYYAQVFANR